MDIKSVLEEITRIKGVSAVAVVGSDGFVIEHATAPGASVDLSFLGGVANSSLAAGQTLAEFFGKGEVSQVLIEFNAGPVLLSSLPESSLVVTLESSQDLGRVRFQLKKYLPKLSDAVMM